NDAAQRFHARATLKDDENPIAKLRFLDIRQGRLPSGMPIEEVLAARPVIKKMEGEPITFHPPTYRPNSYFRRDKPGMWGFSLKGIRDFAPSFLEAEAEAMRIYRGFRRLNPCPSPPSRCKRRTGSPSRSADGGRTRCPIGGR